MEIIGYSERGAMNALFYGIAHDKNDDEMRKLIKLAKNEERTIDGTFKNFQLYSEFSLSEFGDPDMMITATNDIGENVVFFVEAKASCCKYYKLGDQITHHEDYMGGGNKYDRGHASNLFFQLRLKRYFTSLHMPKIKIKVDVEKLFNDDKQNRLKQSRGRVRKIGNNVVVERMVKLLEDSKEAYYIAIIPEQEPKETVDTSGYGFDTYTITWEDIYSNFEKYVGETIRFNQNTDKKKKLVSQILNKPI